MDIKEKLQMLFNCGSTYELNRYESIAYRQQNKAFAKMEGKKLIAELTEQFNALQSENTRLQSIIDEANAQDPEGLSDLATALHDMVLNFPQGDYPSWDQIYDVLNIHKFYARPIPAQQSVDRDTVINVLLSIGNMSEGIIADAIISAIGAQQSPAVAVPDGWKLVPIEPTEEMIEAAHEKCGHISEGFGSDHADHYRAMLASAPAATSSPRITEQDAAVKAWKDAIETLSKGSENGVHPDDVAVNRFSEAMKIKLAKSRDKGRGGWENPALCKVIDLASMLIDHLPKGDPVDVANFAMMLFFREGGNTALSDAGRALLNKLNDKPESAGG